MDQEEAMVHFHVVENQDMKAKNLDSQKILLATLAPYNLNGQFLVVKSINALTWSWMMALLPHLALVNAKMEECVFQGSVIVELVLKAVTVNIEVSICDLIIYSIRIILIPLVCDCLFGSSFVNWWNSICYPLN